MTEQNACGNLEGELEYIFQVILTFGVNLQCRKGM